MDPIASNVTVQAGQNAGSSSKPSTKLDRFNEILAYFERLQTIHQGAEPAMVAEYNLAKQHDTVLAEHSENTYLEMETQIRQGTPFGELEDLKDLSKWYEVEKRRSVINIKRLYLKAQENIRDRGDAREELAEIVLAVLGTMKEELVEMRENGEADGEAIQMTMKWIEKLAS